MKILPFKKTYCDGEIACRFLQSPEGKDLLMAIPGGPGLSGSYLDPFLIELADRANINVGILDLPNHGESMSNTKNNYLYENCLHKLEDAFKQISSECNRLIIFGQSFGARLAFDLLANAQLQIDGAILTALPYKFEHSSQLQKKIEALNIDPQDGELTVLQKIFSAYTVIPFSQEQLLAINSEAKKEENFGMLEGSPPISESAKLILQEKSFVPLTILEGSSDFVTPDDNFLELKKIIPHASFVTIEDAGHFVMIEQPEAALNIFSSFLRHVGDAPLRGVS